MVGMLKFKLHKKESVHVMDGPNTGLHVPDISHLLEVMNRLVDTGNTAIVN
jgi:excinuclease UvrABC ATPase subunit